MIPTTVPAVSRNQNGFACRDMRVKAGLTVDQAAASAGISAPHLRNIEHEHRAASEAHLDLLCALYACSAEALLRDGDNERPVAQNGAACREFRLKADMSVPEAAARAGMSAPHLRNIEHQHRSASDVHLERLAAIYGCRSNSLRREPVGRALAVTA